jgi:signal transduction histidine kinase
MHRSSGLAYAGGAAAVPAPDAARALLTRGPPGGRGQEAASAITADLIRQLADDHDRIARDLNDVVVHRIFAAGLDLEAALGLIGERPGTSRIHHAITGLDQAIRDIRDAVFGIRPRD